MVTNILIKKGFILAKKKSTDEIVGTSGAAFDFMEELNGGLKKDKFEFSEFDDVSIKKSTGFSIIDALLASNDNDRGFQLRTFNTFFGNSGSGKSTLLLQIANNFIKNTDGYIIYYDAENTQTTERIKSLGLDLNKVKIIKQNTTVENYYRLVNRIAEVREKQKDLIGNEYLKNNPSAGKNAEEKEKLKNQAGDEYLMNNPIIVIVDSLSAMASEREIAADTDINSAMGTTAKLHSQLLKAQTNKLFKYNITVLGILQTRDNLQIGPMAKPKDLLYVKQDISLSGGKALPFFSFYLFAMRTKKILDESYGIVGNEVELNLAKSKTSAANKPVTLVFRPTTGFSELWTSFKIMIDQKVISIAGAYKSLPGYEKKFYTKDLENLYNTDEDFRVAFDKAAKDTVKQYIDTIEAINDIDIETDNIEMLAE